MVVGETIAITIYIAIFLFIENIFLYVFVLRWDPADPSYAMTCHVHYMFLPPPWSPLATHTEIL